MDITTVTSGAFNQDASKIKRVAMNGTETKENIVDLLSMPEAADIDFEPPI